MKDKLRTTTTSGWCGPAPRSPKFPSCKRPRCSVAKTFLRISPKLGKDEAEDFFPFFSASDRRWIFTFRNEATADKIRASQWRPSRRAYGRISAEAKWSWDAIVLVSHWRIRRKLVVKSSPRQSGKCRARPGLLDHMVIVMPDGAPATRALG